LHDAKLLLTGLLLALGLGACAPRGAILVEPSAAATGTVIPLLVATPREPAPSGIDFGGVAGPRMSFAEFEVSVPPDRVAGTVTFPPRNRAPDPKRHFLTVSKTPVADEAAFLREVNAELARTPAASRDVFVFVHGFNTTFAEGLYRHAQMSHDFQAPGVSVHFSWPSAGRTTAYGTDRETVLIARDQLQALLRLLARSNANRIVVFGHSMGAMVVMEGMRQTAIAGDRAVLNKIDGVVLLAPDLDIDVFRAQMGPVAAKRIDVFVFTSSGDGALRVSARLRGSTERLGGIASGATIADLPVTVIDLTSFQGEEDVLGHFKFATSPALIAIFAGMGSVGLDILRDQPQAIGLIEAGAGIVTGTTNAIVEPLGPS
jgi:esterase/lipase superfamily enzyme